jgi:hypothetical protein
MRTARLMILAAWTLGGCSGQADVGENDSTSSALSASEQHGHDVWFKSTFGGEKFFSLILPAAPFNLSVGFDAVLASDRNTRFESFGVINDPDCVQGDASTGGLDKCADDANMFTSPQGASAGLVGVRKFANPSYTPTNGQPPILVGVTCAACHAGLDAQHPAADPNHPSWAQINATTGNQYIAIGKLFGAHLSTHDPRFQVFHTWAPGTVDTTAIESDGINNPGIITQFFNLNKRPYFNVTEGGAPCRRRIAPGRAARTTPAAPPPPCASSSTSACAPASAWCRTWPTARAARRRRSIKCSARRFAPTSCRRKRTSSICARSWRPRRRRRWRRRRAARRTSRRIAACWRKGSACSRRIARRATAARSTPTIRSTRRRHRHQQLPLEDDQLDGGPHLGRVLVRSVQGASDRRSRLLPRRAAHRRLGDRAVPAYEPPRHVHRRPERQRSRRGLRRVDERAAQPAGARLSRLDSDDDRFGDHPGHSDRAAQGHAGGAVRQLEPGQPARQLVPRHHRERGPQLTVGCCRRATSTRSPSG